MRLKNILNIVLLLLICLYLIVSYEKVSFKISFPKFLTDGFTTSIPDTDTVWIDTATSPTTKDVEYLEGRALQYIHQLAFRSSSSQMQEFPFPKDKRRTGTGTADRNDKNSKNGIGTKGSYFVYLSLITASSNSVEVIQGSGNTIEKALKNLIINCGHSIAPAELITHARIDVVDKVYPLKGSNNKKLMNRKYVNQDKEDLESGLYGLACMFKNEDMDVDKSLHLPGMMFGAPDVEYLCVENLGENLDSMVKFSTIAYYLQENEEQVGYNVMKLYRNNFFLSKNQQWSQQDILLSAKNGVDFVLQLANPDGTFKFEWDLKKMYPTTMKGATKLIHHCGALYVILQLHKLKQDEALVLHVEKGIKYIIDNHLKECSWNNKKYNCVVTDNKVSLSELAYTLILLCTYSTVFEDDRYIDKIRGLGNMLADLQLGSGQFKPHVLTNYPNLIEDSEVLYFAPGAALFALTNTHLFLEKRRKEDLKTEQDLETDQDLQQEPNGVKDILADKNMVIDGIANDDNDGDDIYIEKALTGASYLVNIRDKDELDSNLSLDNWFLYTVSKLYKIDHNTQYLKRLNLVVKYLLQNQIKAVAEDKTEDVDYHGSFNDGDLIVTAMHIEGMISAFHTLVRIDQETYLSTIDFTLEEIFEAISRGINFILSVQLKSVNVMGFKDSPKEKALGGFLASPSDPVITIDSVQHSINALLGYYNVLNPSANTIEKKLGKLYKQIRKSRY